MGQAMIRKTHRMLQTLPLLHYPPDESTNVSFNAWHKSGDYGTLKQ